MTQKRWNLTVSELGTRRSLHEVEVEATDWVTALTKARGSIGERGGIPPGATCNVSADGKVSLTDAIARRMYQLEPRAASAPPRAPQAAAAPVSVPVAPKPRTSVSPSAPMPSRPAEPPRSVQPSVPARAVEEDARARLTAALKAPRAPARTVAYLPTDTVEDRGEPRTEEVPILPSDRPPRPGDTVSQDLGPDSDLTALPSLAMVFQRDAEPSDASPLRYRERLFAASPDWPIASITEALRREFEVIREALAPFPKGKLVKMAVFDHTWSGQPSRPPVVALQWKDWRGEPEITQLAIDEAARARAAEEAEHARLRLEAEARHRSEEAARARAAEEAEHARLRLEAEARHRSEEAARARAAEEAEHARLRLEAEARHRSEEAARARAAEEAEHARLRLEAEARHRSEEAARARAAEEAEHARLRLEAEARHRSEEAARARAAAAPPAASSAPSAAISHAGVHAPFEAAASPTTGSVRGGNERLADAFEGMQDLGFLQTPLEACEFTLRLVAELVPCEASSIALYDINDHQLRFVACAGEGGAERRGDSIPMNVGLIGRSLMDTLRTLRVADVASEAHYDPAIDGRVGLEAQTMLLRPLAVGDRLLGVLQLLNRVSDLEFSMSDENVITYVAERLGQHLEDLKKRGTTPVNAAGGFRFSLMPGKR